VMSRTRDTQSISAPAPVNLSAACRRLLLYRDVFAGAIGEAWLATLAALAAGADARAEYAGLFGALAESATEADVRLVGDAWQSHLLDRILVDDNPFTRSARRQGAVPNGTLRAAARADLATLRAAFDLSGDTLARAVAESATGGEIISFAGLGEPAGEPNGDSTLRLKAALAADPDWPAFVDRLVDHYAARGVGLTGAFRALRWSAGRLQGIARPDSITLGELVGYDLEREPLLRNTAHFLAGHRANNVLVYGDRGTGKSSTIKALLNEPANRDLRLVEIAKQDLGEFPALVAELRARPERFVVFVDDLSFDEQETQYKSLKAVLEGSLEARPDNVVLYATSNRRHLVQERFSDRTAPDGEIHGFDSVQEKLSLADRFGITVTFLAPDQDRYLAIVRWLAGREGLELPEAELRRQALQWAAWQNGRSGRAARQLVDYLAGEQGR
jgi:uncharacterized protein